ncbi:MAG: NAD(+) diphosphatase [Pseudomonadota bacterium]
MKDAETVTFGGSSLDRKAEWRGDSKRVDAALCSSLAATLPFWRGKPLLGEKGELGWLLPDHSLLEAFVGTRVFLGLDDGMPRFAQDVSAWIPNETPETLHAFFDPSEQRHPDLPASLAFRELRGQMASLSPRAAELAATARAILSWHATHLFCARCGAPSDVSEAGWQRVCPSCGARHFPRTDPVVIMLILRGNDVLVGRSPGWPDGMYSLLAGFVEPGETIEAAVRREVYEESQVRVGDVSYLASQPWPFPASLMIGCLGWATTHEIKVDPVELEDAAWVSRERMMAIVAGEDTGMRAARPGSIARFLIERWLADRLD